jgi:chemotaxis protein methyltransferase CheR
MMQTLSTSDIEIRLLIEAIYLRYSYDFRDYSAPSQARRVLHAMVQMDCRTVSELQSRVLHDAEAFARLLQYLTIPTSEMFRDPSYFLALREQVVPLLKTYPSLKIWIAGCSTGEEVVSMAILLHEEGLLERCILYATDINAHSLDQSRKGVYALDRMEGYARSYHEAGGRANLSDYYTAAYGAALFDRTLLERVSFSDHSLATDSVFSETQLICCRNVMIYFNRALQERALGLFHESLCHRGCLALGSKESLDFSDHARQFEPLVRSERIYRKSVLENV